MMRKLYVLLAILLFIVVDMGFFAISTKANDYGPNSPTYVDLRDTIRVRNSQVWPEILNSVKIASGEKILGKADFIFVIDTTGSMGGDIEDVKNNLTNFTSSMIAESVDVRFAVIEYKDITVNGETSTVVHTFNGSVWTNKSSDINDCLSSFTISGGGDGPETPTNAFAKMFNDFSFRSDASRFAFLLTDAEAKGNGSTEDEISPSVYDEEIVDMASIINQLSRLSIHTSVVSKTYYEEHYRSLFEQTGGIFIDIDSDFTNVMLSLADWVSYETVTTAYLKLDVLERGSFKDSYNEASLAVQGIICNIDNANVYLDSNGKPVTEASLAALYNIGRYAKTGFTADGNTRLILRVQSTKAGIVTFTISDDLGATLETLQRSVKSKTTISVPTTPIEGTYPHQASAVLIAPKDFPYPSEWPSSKFNVAVHFVPTESPVSAIDISRQLSVNAVPVVLIHGFTAGATVDGSFGNESVTVGIRGMLNAAGMKNFVFACNYDGSKGPRYNIPDNTMETVVFKAVADAIRRVAVSGIACTRVDLIGYSMGGLIAQRFIQNDKGNLTTMFSYGQGMVHRLITVATPSTGTPLASYLMNPLFQPMKNIIPGTGILANVGSDLALYKLLIGGRLAIHAFYGYDNDDALRDMMLDSVLIQSLKKSSVPVHSLYGDITFKELLGGAINSLYEINGFIDNIHPLFASLLRFVPSVISNAPNALAIERIFYGNDGHDIAVGKSSATAASNALTGYSGLAYNHMNICMMDDVGNSIVALLKAKESSFDVSGVHAPTMSITTVKSFASSSYGKFVLSSVNATTDYEENDGEADSIDPDTYFVQNIALSADSLTLEGAGSVVFTATPDGALSNDVYLMASIGGKSKLYLMTSNDVKTSFIATMDFSETGIVDVSCFTQGNENNVYVSNTLRVVVRPKISEAELVTAMLSFPNAPDITYVEVDEKDGEVTYTKKMLPGVIHTNVSSDVAIGLYVTTLDGKMYDVSAPSMGTEWTSNSIATVTAKGTVHGLREGITTLTARYGNLTKSISIDVGPAYDILTPTDDSPADNNPTDNSPADNSPADNSPTDNSPADDNPTDNNPADNSPTDNSPADNSPADNSPADNSPTDNSPTDNSPADDNPTDNNPADNSPADNILSSSNGGCSTGYFGIMVLSLLFLLKGQIVIKR